MATAKPVQLPIPDDFSAFEQFLVRKTELALVEGLELEQWTRDPNRKIDRHLLNLNRQYNLQNKAYGYFANVHVNGQTLTALGALQKVEFGRIQGPNPEQRLKDYVLRLFLNTAKLGLSEW